MSAKPTKEERLAALAPYGFDMLDAIIEYLEDNTRENGEIDCNCDGGYGDDGTKFHECFPCRLNRAVAPALKALDKVDGVAP